MGNFDDRMMRLAAAQHLVVARRQLLEFGSEAQVKYRIKHGPLERVHESVYRIAGSPDTWRQRLMAGCFAGGKLSVGSFRAAAQMKYLPGGMELVEITSQRHRRARHDGVIAHESRFLTDLDVMYVDNIPITRPARTINDLGLLVEQGELAAAILDHAMHDAVRRNLVDVERVWREWERLGGEIRPGADAVAMMLEKFRPPAVNCDTSPELRLLQITRNADLPEPIPQHRVWISNARWFDLDLAWPWLKLYVEFDSYKFHGNRDKYMKDATRRLLLRAAGWDGVSVTDDELDRGAPLAIEVLRDLISRAS